jgi:ADP-ribose pyrophosphatase YjhB (NUDIX family)
MENTPCTYRISVKSLIKDKEGRILLIREKDGRWELPGGGLEHGEDPTIGLSREVEEEIGFKVEHVAPSPSAFWTINKKVGHPEMTWFAFVAYDVQVSGEIKLGHNDEAHEARYVAAEEAKQLPLHENTQPYFD